ncbi:uncharacterized protein LOC128683966 isoform X2 [Plodia interpunctella]|uniref:uncharacterized protein LOC128683966 isoform X2 n=1 Tax=Plodia interpunctella TaxID=58824 RepID=UPI0023676A35|nr:uncharacterized protein LOC128683966 isoform X2 [Plodia interpunctella]
MAFSDSMFLFEIILEKLSSFINCKTFIIRGQFADVFSVELRDPFGIVVVPKKKKTKRKTIRNTKSHPKLTEKSKLKCGQSILVRSQIEKLKSNMVSFPIELSLWDCFNPEDKLGSTQIFWDQAYINYLSKIINKSRCRRSVTIRGDYNVFDETTSKRMATVSLKIKFMHIKPNTGKSISSYINANIVGTLLRPVPAPRLEPAPSAISNNQNNVEPFETGIVVAKYNRKKESSGRKNNKKLNPNKNISPSVIANEINNESIRKEEIKPDKNQVVMHRISKSLIDISKCPSQSDQIYDLGIAKSKSFTIIKKTVQPNAMDYIFGDQRQSFGNKVYCVGYFTVENATAPPSPNQGTSDIESSGKSVESKPKYKIRICDSECPGKKFGGETDSQSHLSIDLPADAENIISVKKCEAVECNAKKHKEPPPRPDDRILIDLGRPQIAQKIEEVVGGIDAKLKLFDDPCFCTCECTFGFTKKTTYCKVCGGYEVVGEEIVGKDGQAPFPCPIFHKLDKNKSRTMMSTSGSDSKKTGKSFSKTDKQNSEAEKSKKGKLKKKDDRFKFNYGYEAPHIGHSQCAMPCKGTLGAVPKHMGWLWTAEDIPGMKFRPMWRPGATNKHVVRLLRMAKNPGEIMAKKRRRDQKPKRSLIRPLLIVHKKDGEYTVTMETMKTYNKPRAINQYPYEDKPLLTYTIGRTEAENRDRQKKREREHRRLERMQRHFIQSAFRDMCHEICLKTYQQALGILPTTESPDCPCFPAHPDAMQANEDVSCSCSEAESREASDTDSDEWIVEFTPPSAKFDPKFKTKKIVKVDNSSQYTYLDYRVKLFDKFGNPVQRFFKGPDGKQQCSDLGGFWSPEHKWLEINVDGFIAPDGRWAPNSFIGPNGDIIEAEGGKFQIANGKWLVIGIDGYVDAQNKWRAYSRPRAPPQEKKKVIKKDKGAAGDKKAKPVSSKPSEVFSCFGDVSPKFLSELGIVGHGTDKKQLYAALKDLIARGEQVKIPERPLVPRLPPGKGRKIQIRTPNIYDARNLKCQHPTPSSKGILAVNTEGDKVYFKMKDAKNRRPKQRLEDLTRRGISLSSFHVPCFHSFINAEMMKKQLQEKMIASNPHNKSVATEAHPGNVLVYPGNLRPTT